MNLFVNGLAVFVTGRILPGVTLDDFLTAIVVSVVLGVVNTFIKPVLVLFTLPVNILSLGLFTFVINALVVLIVDALVPGFRVDGFWTALFFSLVLSFVSAFLHSLTS
jgi:putative membrane protein